MILPKFESDFFRILGLISYQANLQSMGSFPRPEPNRAACLAFEDHPSCWQLEVVLDFACCRCGHDVGVTLKCEGTGLRGRHRPARQRQDSLPHLQAK